MTPEKKWKSYSPAKGAGKKLSDMSFFELSVVSVMPDDVYHEIKKRIELALTYLEDGAVHTSGDVLRSLTGGKKL
jgi:hypothetical protein